VSFCNFNTFKIHYVAFREHLHATVVPGVIETVWLLWFILRSYKCVNHSWHSKKQTIQTKAFLQARNVVSRTELMECPPGRFYLFCWLILVKKIVFFFIFVRGRKNTCFCVKLLSKKEFQHKSVIWKIGSHKLNAVFIILELHFSGLIGAAKHPDIQEIRTIWLFFENRLHCQFEFRLLLFTVRTCV
jgi:hypothetical protein